MLFHPPLLPSLRLPSLLLLVKQTVLISILLGVSLTAAAAGNDENLPYYDKKQHKFDDFPKLPKNFSTLKPARDFDDNIRELVKSIESEHFLHPDPVTQHKKIFSSYLEAFDPQKRFFTKTDQKWIRSYQNNFKNSISNGHPKPIYKIHNLYRKRFVHSMLTYIHLLDHHKFNFSIEETINTAREDLEHPAGYSQWFDLRRKEIKNILLTRLIDGSALEKAKTSLRKRYVNRLNFFLEGEADEVLDFFANALVGTFDPHSRYLTPENYQSFKEDHSLRLEGIGAFIGAKDDYIEIFRLVEGGPAKKSKDVVPGDRIIGVAEGNGEFKDVIGMSTSNVVKLIRGKKDSVVRLELLPAGKSIGYPAKIVSITRDVITQKDRRAYRQTLTLPGINHSWKIGVITVDSFYGAFDQNEGPTASNDVRNLVNELKQDGVDGIVLDLRGNGGGLLTEAMRMAAIFLPRGPILRIKQNNQRTATHGSVRNSLVWDGPLAVIVDRLSASASEIVAAAMQDYNRALIIGDTTYGKGTVQSPVDIDNGEHGRVFITISKFYRINGGSTQNKGVIPDVRLPSAWDHETIGESALDNALEWDSIDHANYRLINRDWYDADSLNRLQVQHNERQKVIPYLRYLNDIIESTKESDAITTIPLERNAREKWIENERIKILQAENKYRQATNQDTFSDWDALEAFRDEERRKDNFLGTPADNEIRAEVGRILIDSIAPAIFAHHDK